jgi:predicted transcriptional regulator
MPGNPAKYDKLDIVNCFLLLSKQQSRGALLEQLQLGEGSIRSILDILKDKGLIDPSNQGHIHSNTGKDVYDKISNEISFHESDSKSFLEKYFPLFKNDVLLCVQLKEYNQTLKDVYLLRDWAVRTGADGLLTLQYLGDKLRFPQYESAEDFTIVEELFGINKCGTVLIVTAKDKHIAKRALLNVVDNLTSIFNEF